LIAICPAAALVGILWRGNKACDPDIVTAGPAAHAAACAHTLRSQKATSSCSPADAQPLVHAHAQQSSPEQMRRSASPKAAPPYQWVRSHSSMHMVQWSFNQYNAAPNHKMQQLRLTSGCAATRPCWSPLAEGCRTPGRWRWPCRCCHLRLGWGARRGRGVLRREATECYNDAGRLQVTVLSNCPAWEPRQHRHSTAQRSAAQRTCQHLDGDA
jgi:hypothetical protein